MKCKHPEWTEFPKPPPQEMVECQCGINKTCTLCGYVEGASPCNCSQTLKIFWKPMPKLTLRQKFDEWNYRRKWWIGQRKQFNGMVKRYKDMAKPKKRGK